MKFLSILAGIHNFRLKKRGQRESKHEESNDRSGPGKPDKVHKRTGSPLPKAHESSKRDGTSTSQHQSPRMCPFRRSHVPVQDMEMRFGPTGSSGDT